MLLSATAADGLTVDGTPLTGEVRLTADHAPIPRSRVAAGERRLVVPRREGLWAVRDFVTAAPARRTFTGIEATPYDERWVVPGSCRPYAAERSVRVQNADGRERGLGLPGEPAFTLGGAEHTLAVAVEGDGSLWAVLADATSGKDTYRFCFPRLRVPTGRRPSTSTGRCCRRAPSPRISSAPSRRPATPCPAPSRRGSGTSWPADTSHDRPRRTGGTRRAASRARARLGRNMPLCR